MGNGYCTFSAGWKGSCPCSVDFEVNILIVLPVEDTIFSELKIFFKKSEIFGKKCLTLSANGGILTKLSLRGGQERGQDKVETLKNLKKDLDKAEKK